MPELTLEFEVYCARCGAGLCQNSTERKGGMRATPGIDVGPCETCLEVERDAGRDEGRAAAEKEIEESDA